MGASEPRDGSTGSGPANGRSAGVEQGQPTNDCRPDSNHLRLLFDNMLEGYAYCRMIFDTEGRPEDFVYVDVNPAFGKITGLMDVVGKRVTDVIPGIRESNPELFETYGRVTSTGESEHVEVSVEQLGIVLDVSVFRPEQGHFVAVFENITDRKRAEERLEELVRFLEFRVEQRTSDLADALRILNREPDDSEEPDPTL